MLPPARERRLPERLSGIKSNFDTEYKRNIKNMRRVQRSKNHYLPQAYILKPKLYKVTQQYIANRLMRDGYLVGISINTFKKSYWVKWCRKSRTEPIPCTSSCGCHENLDLERAMNGIAIFRRSIGDNPHYHRRLSAHNFIQSIIAC